MCTYLQDFLNLTDEQKKLDANKVRMKHPKSVPVILLPEKSNTVQEIKSVKYLVAEDISLACFIMKIRAKCNLPAEKALFFYINNAIPPNYTLMKDLYELHKDEHGYLVLTYCSENCFGSFVSLLLTK